MKFRAQHGETRGGGGWRSVAVQLMPANLQPVARRWGAGAAGDMVCYISNTPRSAHDSHLD